MSLDKLGNPIQNGDFVAYVSEGRPTCCEVLEIKGKTANITTKSDRTGRTSTRYGMTLGLI